jgi:hypothetical protein
MTCDPRDGQREQIFDQLIIVETLRTRFEQPLAQPRSVPGGIILLVAAGVLVHAAPS